MKQTPLNSRHRELGAKMVDFAGWDMPLQYQGVIAEHSAVRSKYGLFDVSHMGRIDLVGKGALKLANLLSTNLIDKPICYTVFANEEGFCVDDLLVYTLSNEHIVLICNASRRDVVLPHVKLYAGDVEVVPYFDNHAIIALQGPEAGNILLYDLEPFHFLIDKDLIISATGYTGEKGFEIIGDAAQVVEMWDHLIHVGATPCGLGARDTLRLEKGYALYGHELSETIRPTESVAKWAVKLEKNDFIGKQAVVENPPTRSQYWLKVDGAIPRLGTKAFKGDNEVGVVTSGGYSPTLKCGIAIVMGTDKPDTLVIRGVKHEAIY